MAKQSRITNEASTAYEQSKSDTVNGSSGNVALYRNRAALAPAASVTAQATILCQLDPALRRRALLRINQTQGNLHAQRLVATLQRETPVTRPARPPAYSSLTQRISAATPAAVIQRSPLSEAVAGLWDRNRKGPFFDRLRSLTEQARADPDLRQFVNTSDRLGDDDRWLAQSILDHGPEALWPAALMEERHRRATQHRWAPEPGGIEGTLGLTAQGRSVSAFYFPGVNAERALIIGGMHGSELSAVQVAEQLVDDLRSGRGPRPFFTVIIVPRLFPDNIAHAEAEAAARPQTVGSTANIGRYTRQTPTRSVDPNRQFPRTGRAPGQGNRDARNRPIEAENLMLLELIQRFRPTRVANLHAIRTVQGAGIYADPRTNAAGIACGFAADRDLALAMAVEAERRGARTPGSHRNTNPDVNAIYPLDPAAARAGRRQRRSNVGGTSFGTWGATEVRDAAHPEFNRPAMTVITVEVAGAHRVADLPAAEQAARQTEIQGHVATLQEIFLGEPGSGGRPANPPLCPAPPAAQPTPPAPGRPAIRRAPDEPTGVSVSGIRDPISPRNLSVRQAAETSRLSRQHEPGAAAAGAGAPDPQRQLAERILGEVALSGGITVAVYPISTVGAAAEFQRQATQFAVDHRALGIARGALREGVAMEIAASLPMLLSSLNTRIQTLLARYPDLTGSRQPAVTVQTLAIFTHGERDQLQVGAHGQWIKNSLAPWVRGLAPYLTPGPRVLLYACSTAGQPARGIPFAEAMRELLQSELEQRYGLAAGVAPEVWGHTTAAHTTANKALVMFGGGPVSSGGDNFLAILGRRLATAAIEQSGHGGALTEQQRAQIERHGVRAIGRVFQTTSAQQGSRHPLNTYIREIPQMGIDRVWRDISTPASPNLSDLHLAPEAAARMAEGLREFQARFVRQREALVRRVNSIVVR